MSNIDKRPYRADGGDISTGRLKEIADNPYGDEEKCWLAKRMLALLDEVEVATDACNGWQIKFAEADERLEAAEKRLNEILTPNMLLPVIDEMDTDNLRHVIKTASENYSLLHAKWESADNRIAELEAREVKLPERYEVEMCPTPSPEGDWYSREDVLAALATAGVRACEEGEHG